MPTAPTDPSGVRTKILTRGHYRIVMRPFPMKDDRYPTPTALKHGLLRNEVHIQGWSYPPVMEDLLIPAGDHVHAAVSFEGFNEYYRLYNTGQFAHLRGFWEDWGEERRNRRPPSQDEPRFLWLDGVLGTFVGAHRFARNLVEDTKADSLELEVSMNGVDHRHLEISGSIFGWARGDPQTPNANWTKTWRYPRNDLIASADDLGWEAFAYACEMMNYDLPRKYPHEWKERRAKL